MNDDYSYLVEYKTRMAELQDIAAMDRLAAELAPPSALRRWVEQRRAAKDGAAVRPLRVRRLHGSGRARHA
ncbi:MAG TPA: hypothetical protein VIT20_00995 [Propionibacteriaceae bacterium]